MHEMSKRQKKEPQGKDAAMVLLQSKMNNPSSQQSMRMCPIATKQRTKRGRMPKMRRMRMNLHLQRNTNCIQGEFANGSWIWEPQSTWLYIRRHSTPIIFIFFQTTCIWVMIAFPLVWSPLSLALKREAQGIEFVLHM